MDMTPTESCPARDWTLETKLRLKNIPGLGYYAGKKVTFKSHELINLPGKHGGPCYCPVEDLEVVE
jgi:hypothetical protein